MSTKIRIVLPDGSMEEVVNGLMTKAGMPVTVSKRRTKEGTTPVPWIQKVVYQRPQEIPHWLYMDLFDIAICGEDWIRDWNYSFPVLAKLPIGRSGTRPVRIVVAVSKESGISRASELPFGAKVATEYMRLASHHFHTMRSRSDIKILPSYGNTEHKIRFGADAIVDVVESGRALEENGLVIIEEIMESSTVIVATDNALGSKTKKSFLGHFAALIVAAYESSSFVQLTANVPDRIVPQAAKIMGGLKGPSRSRLCGVRGWSALQSMVPVAKEHEVMFSLSRIGVKDIIVNRNLPLVMRG